jgi:hypothetical protein
MKFSQRIGITPLAKEIQLESMDEELRNGLWNIYDTSILDKLTSIQVTKLGTSTRQYYNQTLWRDLFKKPVDEIPILPEKVIRKIREYFFSCTWYQVYNLIEFTMEFELIISLRETKWSDLYNQFNYILEREFSGYRFVNKILSPITNTSEIKELEESISQSGSFTALKSCNTHLIAALAKLSDRLNPDYRNSIKESISAVESVAKVISGNAKDSLGGALDKVKSKLKIHAALERGFKQIYGYTSDSDGIRHAMTEESTCDFEDAKYMLISCSAFINYLIAKANKAGIQFS